MRDPTEAPLSRSTIVQEIDRAALDLNIARSFEEALHTLALQTRLTIGAHQCAISYIPLGDFHAAVHTTSFSEKYEAYKSYDVMPNGAGIWRLVLSERRAVRMSEQELRSHAMWRNFSDLKDARGLRHPPMRGWLATPVLRPSGEVLGLLQLSDKSGGGDFTEDDLSLLVRLAKMVFPAFELQFVNEQLVKRTLELQRANGELKELVQERTDQVGRARVALQDNQEQLRSALQFREAVMANMGEGLYTVDAQGKTTYMNAAAERLFGWSSAELLGKKMHDMTHHHHPDGRPFPAEECPGLQVLTKGLSLAEQDSWFIRKDGTFFPVVYNSSPILMDGAVVGVVVVFRDVTERRRAEEHRRRLEAQLQHAQKLESLGVLAGGIAHDFNNLLTSILGYADLALFKLPPGSPARPIIGEVVNGARRAAELTKQMLAYSGKGRFVVEPVDLSALVEDMVRLLQISISKKCVIKLDLMAGLPAVEADAAQVRQVVMNLVINASEAIGERSGVIAIRTGVMYCDRAYLEATYLDEDLPEGQYVTLEVADNGCGMSEEIRAKIFEPFFTTKFTGRGLGLAAVLGIVRGHRGAMKCYSEPSRGTTFKILLPPAAMQARSLEEAAPSEMWRGSGTVLVVDDEESVRALARGMLEALGFAVLTACDGREGIEVYRTNMDRIRFVLLDMTMPHLDGEETFRELRRLRGDVKAILSSGYNEQTVSSRFAGKGLSGFLQKPYRLEELQAVVRKAIEG